VTISLHAETPDAVLDVRGLSVRLGGRTILDTIDLRVAPGEFVGLIGSNGAGKTTFLRVALGLLRPSAGTIRIAEQPGRHRPSVRYLPQKVALDSDAPLRARDIVALGLDGGRLGVRLPSSRNAQAIDEILEAVGASEFADQRIGRLSGGQQQRVLLAHALISRPRLLLLDEPLANLDPVSVHDIVGLLAELCRERDVAVLLSAHDINPLMPVMDRVVYLAEGRAAVGTTDEVVQSEVLTRLYGRAINVVRAEGHVFVVTADEAELTRGGRTRPGSGNADLRRRA
jgi:zinc/manganese transport system ATP-binding protein